MYWGAEPELETLECGMTFDRIKILQHALQLDPEQCISNTQYRISMVINNKVRYKTTILTNDDHVLLMFQIHSRFDSLRMASLEPYVEIDRRHLWDDTDVYDSQHIGLSFQTTRISPPPVVSIRQEHLNGVNC